MGEKTTIGWHEPVALPDLGLDHVYAKIDSGADTSSLHGRDISLVTLEGGDEVAEFTAPLLRSQADCSAFPAGGFRRVRAKVVDSRIVRSSNGQEEERPVIETLLRLGEKEFPARFTLTNREGMRFSLLLGREALKEFLIEPSTCHRLEDASCPE